MYSEDLPKIQIAKAVVSCAIIACNRLQFLHRGLKELHHYFRLGFMCNYCKQFLHAIRCNNCRLSNMRQKCCSQWQRFVKSRDNIIIVPSLLRYSLLTIVVKLNSIDKDVIEKAFRQWCRKFNVTRHMLYTRIRQLPGSGRVVTTGYPDPVPGEIPYPSPLKKLHFTQVNGKWHN